ncbi:hypothetical protein ZWY2020_022365 [Hordeum vulgare]|nr:hypothetical protein ZWY2020_022365 [Hordeum vulgare]
MIHDHQRVKGTTQMMRATSGNMMMHRNLGNLNTGASARSSLDRSAKAAAANDQAKAGPPGSNRYAFCGMGNIVSKPADQLCRALSHRTDPEKLKEMGNEEYREGHYAEAVALYDQAIMMDPTRPAYWSNKAAALAALSRLIDAVADCKEAVRIDPPTAARTTGSADCISVGEGRIAKCTDARKVRDWITVLQESQAAVSDGADCAPQVMALQAEALLKLQRHDETDSALRGALRFGVDRSARPSAPPPAYVLMVRAQVDMAAGRLEEAVATAQTACELDPGSRETANVHRRAKVVASARQRGNDLFKASDCNGALAVRPGYSKARLRRADCNVKLERWEASLRDYQVLIQELPENEDVKKALAEVEVKLKSQRN